MKIVMKSIEVSSDFDSSEEMMIISKRTEDGEEVGGRALLNYLHFHSDNWEKLVGRSPYVNSGLWRSYKEDGRHHYTVDVGCSCSHDCCGHLCGLNFEIVEMSKAWVVTVSKSFNY